MVASFCRLIKRSSAFRIGNPALIKVRNCWLKMTNGPCLTFRPPR